MENRFKHGCPQSANSFPHHAREISATQDAQRGITPQDVDPSVLKAISDARLILVQLQRQLALAREALAQIGAAQ